MHSNFDFDVLHFIPVYAGAKSFLMPCFAIQYTHKYNAAIIMSGECDISYESQQKFHDVKFVRIDGFKIGSNPFDFFSSILCILSLIIRSRPKVVVGHYSLGALIPLFCSFVLGVNHRIYFNHGVSFKGYHGPIKCILYLIEKINIYLATEIITVSNGAFSTLDNICHGNKTVSMIFNGSAAGLNYINYSFDDLLIAKQHAKHNIGYLDHETVLLYVGRPVKRKGIFEVLSIMEGLVRTNKNFKLIVAGFTAADIDIDIHLYNSIRFVGYQDSLDSFYLASDFVLLPSKHEGFGYSLAEGASKGCIPIATDNDGPKDIIKNECSGFIVRHATCVAESIKIIRNVSSNTELKNSISYCAHLSVKKYNRLDFVKFYHRFFERILSGESNL